MDVQRSANLERSVTFEAILACLEDKWEGVQEKKEQYWDTYQRGRLVQLMTEVVVNQRTTVQFYLNTEM